MISRLATCIFAICAERRLIVSLLQARPNRRDDQQEHSYNQQRYAY
jgi:hypothetical protein